MIAYNDTGPSLLMLLALAFALGGFVVAPVCYLLGRRHGRLATQRTALPMPGMSTYGAADDAMEPTPEQDVRAKWKALRDHADVAQAHETGTYWRE